VTLDSELQVFWLLESFILDHPHIYKLTKLFTKSMFAQHE